MKFRATFTALVPIHRYQDGEIHREICLHCKFTIRGNGVVVLSEISMTRRDVKGNFGPFYKLPNQTKQVVAAIHRDTILKHAVDELYKVGFLGVTKLEFRLPTIEKRGQA